MIKKEFDQPTLINIKELANRLKLRPETIQNKLSELFNDNVLIEIKDLFIKYKPKLPPALNNVTLNLVESKFHIFLGQNGAGKSTLIKVLVKSIDKFSGTVNYTDNLVVNGHKHISYCPDKVIFNSSASIYNYLFWLGSISIENKQQLESKINYYLQKFKIFEIKNKSVNSLSAGQKRIITLISIFLEKTKLIILDEPMINLDPKIKYLVFEELKLKQKQGTTIFISTHQIDEILKYADYITFINKGNIVYHGNYNETLLKQLLNKYFTEKEN